MNFRQWTVLTVFPLFVLLLAVLAVIPATPASAQDAAGDEPEANAVSGDEAADAVSRKERKALAKEKRIEEYLRKKEEKRLRKEQSLLDSREPEREATARDLEAKQFAQTPPPTPAAQAQPAPVRTRTADVRRKPGRRQASPLPRDLARAQANVRSTDLALDATVQQYLALIDRQQASAHQLAAFGNFLAQSGLTRDGLQYYEVALSLEQTDPVLWINAGSLHQQLKDYSTAESAYGRALALAPNNALAHYNLGSVFRDMDRYDDALASYKAALFLDPSLGDPTVNPQAANNNLLTAVKLMLYEEQVGSLSLPLIEIPTANQYGDRPAGSK